MKAKKMTMNDPYPIPPGLSPEQEQAFKALAESNTRLAGQIRDIRGVVKSGITQGEDPSMTRKSIPLPDKAVKTVKVIKDFCRQCVGGGGRKAAAKLVRECADVECRLYPFREGKNPFHKLNLSEEQRKRRSARILISVE